MVLALEMAVLFKILKLYTCRLRSCLRGARGRSRGSGGGGGGAVCCGRGGGEGRQRTLCVVCSFS